MSGIAGIIHADSRRPVGLGVIPALIAGAPIAARPVSLDGPGSLLLGLGDAHAERLADAQIVAALDYELPPTMPARTPGAGIRQLYEEFGAVFPAQLRGAFSVAL
ncbi:MAG TPA: hypothetical protein VFF12_13585 [Myxococcaceae bacterium]|nr:hypothetical protein [Myxococcaceae bacterium]